MSSFDPDSVALVVIVVGLSASLLLGWFLDGTHPVDGASWRDQDRYARVSGRIANGHLPLRGDLHNQIGYNLLGALGHIVWPSHPFLLVSLGLLLGSAIFCYWASRAYLSVVGTLVFLGLLFYWDGSARTFNYATELFVIPWNNQVAFFVMSFFFWLLATRATPAPSWGMVLLTGFIGGFGVLAREETAFFFAPLTAAFLLYSKARPSQWLASAAIAAATFAPQLIVRAVVLGSPLATGRSYGETYGDLAATYLSASRFLRNVVDVIFWAPGSSERLSVVQASPWLWVAPIGVGLLIWTRSVKAPVRVWIVVSLALTTFYLAGENVSAQKLKFHCIRYFAGGLVAANFSVSVLGSKAWGWVTTRGSPNAGRAPVASPSAPVRNPG